MVRCKHCNGTVVSKRADAQYCSSVCGNRYRKKKHYDNNPEHYKEKRTKSNSQVEKRILSRVKSRAKTNGIAFDLTTADITVPDECPVLGIKLVTTNQGQGYHVNSPSLDRIVPELGYTSGNVRVISARANLLKNDATAHELRLVLQDLERIEHEVSV